MKQDSARPRLDPDVRKLVDRNAEANARSIPKEVNFALRMHYQLRERLPVVPPAPQPQPSAKSVKLCRCH